MSNDLISRSALMNHIESQHRQWGEDYDAEQILGDIEDFSSAYAAGENGAYHKASELVKAGGKNG